MTGKILKRPFIAPAGVLHFRSISAFDLKCIENVGDIPLVSMKKRDTGISVSIRYIDQIYTTEPCDEGDLNPKWEEDFKLEVLKTSNVDIVVFMNGSLDEGIVLGSTSVPITQFTKEKPFDKRINLYKTVGDRDDIVGSIEFDVTFTPKTKMSIRAKNKLSKSPESIFQRRVIIRVISYVAHIPTNGSVLLYHCSYHCSFILLTRKVFYSRHTFEKLRAKILIFGLMTCWTFLDAYTTER
jgi:hypothetical protein